jgi:NADPH:quinone reductase-like Zn-dependent oxidoreductase
LVRRPAQIKELKDRYGDQIHVVAFDGTNDREAANEINVITQNEGVQYGTDNAWFTRYAVLTRSLVLECVGGATTEFALSVLNNGGRLLLYGGSGGVAEFKVSLTSTLFKGHRIEGFRLEPWIAGQGPEAVGKLIGELMQLLATGKLVPALEDVIAFEDFQTAIVKSVTPGKLGKVFLAPNPAVVTKNTSFVSQK